MQYSKLIAAYLTISFVTISATPAQSRIENRDVSVKSGVQTTLTQPHSIDEFCGPRNVPIEIIEKPKNGRVIVTDKTVKIGDFGGGRQMKQIPLKCRGKQTKGKAVSYKSTAGFKGRDFFSFRAKLPSLGWVTVKYNVNVK